MTCNEKIRALPSNCLLVGAPKLTPELRAGINISNQVFNQVQHCSSWQSIIAGGLHLGSDIFPQNSQEAPTFNDEGIVPFLNSNVSCSTTTECKETAVLSKEEANANKGRFINFRRSKDESMINNYHPILLQALKCSIDIQAVTNEMSIAYNVAKYMSLALKLQQIRT
ncbi:unnamed protein product [Allacma fusca]|uniref:Uncharacterized protein n=1 Tax=Allacma fusca TaxID=39272 RepID=A0A8J2KSD6_9HEXA|nr:unnamed protein product [Allacma fusca]